MEQISELFCLTNALKNQKNNLKTAKRLKGLTLIELLIVIAVLGILAAAVLVAINPTVKLAQTKDSQRKASVSQLGNAMQSYLTLNGKYPLSSSGWIGDLISAGELKTAPPQIPNNAYCSTNNQNGYCYYVNANQSEAKIYVLLESPSGCPSGTAYFIWSSITGANGVHCDSNEISLPEPTPTNTPTPTPTATPTPIPPVTLTASGAGQTGSIQMYTIPSTRSYRIEAWGAASGDTTYSNYPSYPGRGTYIKGEFILSEGTVLKILVGQKGDYGVYESGGGGGTFVVDGLSNGPYIIAGGGGGAFTGKDDRTNYTDASVSNNGRDGSGYPGSGGTNGNGGGPADHIGFGAAGGGGLTGDGFNGLGDSTGGLSFTHGGNGGKANSPSDPHYAGSGGFGGGGGSEHQRWGTGGGGGGYSGGGGGFTHTQVYTGAGGGGGSYNGGINQINTVGMGTSNGKVIITQL